jgi:Tfp pilus assembly protein PilE
VTQARARKLTLPDLLVLLVTAGLLVAALVPELGALHRRTFVAAMRGDLRRLAAAEESYFYDHRVYAADPRDLQVVGFRQSPDVRLVMREATAAGWSAVASHVETSVRCALYVGKAAPVGTAHLAGVTDCR